MSPAEPVAGAATPGAVPSSGDAGDGDGSAPPAAASRLDAFVSYRRLEADSEFVDRLQAALAAGGKEIWVDRNRIEPAADWSERIARGIAAAKAFVFVLTPESLASPECRRELDTATSHNKLVVPVVLREVDRSALPEALTRPNWIFFTPGHDFEAAVAEVGEALEADLDWRDAHARLTVRTEEWARSRRDRSFLLRGSDLRGAEQWLAASAAHERTPPTTVQSEYILASRKAADRAQRTWRAALSTGLVVAVTLAALALVQRNEARQEARLAESRALAAEATADLSSDPLTSLSLALRSTGTDPSGPAEQALRLALAQSRLRMVVRSGLGGAAVAAWDPRRPEIALTAPGGRVELWDTDDGRLVRTLRTGGRARVSELAFDAGGDRLAAVAASGSLWMWDLGPTGATAIPTGRVDAAVRAGVAHLFSGSLIGLSALWIGRGDDELALFGAGVTNVLVFEPTLGRTVPLFRTPLLEGAPYVAANPDGNRMLVEGELLDFTDGSERALPGYDGSDPGPECFLPDGSAVVTSTTVDAGGPIEEWSVASGRSTASMQTPVGPTTAVACSAGAGEDWVAGGDAAGNLVLRLPDGSVVPLYGHSDVITSIASSPDGRYLATASDDGTARVWDASTGRSIAVLSGAGSPLEQVAFDGGGGLVLTVDSGGFVRIWDAGVGQPVTELDRPGRGTTVALGFEDAGRRILGLHATFSSGPKARVASASILSWDASSGRLLGSVPLPGLAPGAVPCSRQLQSAGTDAGMTMLSGSPCLIPPPPRLAVGVPVPRPLGYDAGNAVLELLAVAASADGSRVAYATNDAVVLLDAAGRRLGRLSVRGRPAGLSFVSGDRLLATTTAAAYLWAPPGRRVVTFALHGAPIDAALSASGGRLAAVTSGGEVEVFDAASGKLVRSLRPTAAGASTSDFPATPLRVALDAAGDVVAAGSADGTVTFWQVASGRRIATRAVAGWPVIELEPSAGGRRLLAVDWPQAGSGVNPPGAAEVLDASSGAVVAAYKAPAPLRTPINPGAALSADGDYLFAGDLGLAPSSPGGIAAAYQVSTASTMADLQASATSGPAAYSLAAVQPWSPGGSALLAGVAVYACDACGSLAELRSAAADRLAWSKPLSAARDVPPASDPYR